MPSPSSALTLFFVAQVLLLAAFWIWLAGWRTAAGLALWLGATGLAAYAGWLRFGPWPPPVGFVIIPGLLITVALAFSRWGSALMSRAGIAVLIGYQSFRILVECFLWWGHREGVVPVQMTWEGRNYDVFSGLAALPLAWWVATGQPSRMLIGLWNLAGLGLLVNIVTVAVLSMPSPFRYFSPPNLFVAQLPFIWLPTFLVTSALLGHLLVFRWLRKTE